jgi:hypothetical protein
MRSRLVRRSLGQNPSGDSMVSQNWKYATYALGALVVAQFFWWDSKAPQVLNLPWHRP